MAVTQWCEDFELPSKEWFFTGAAGFDFAKGFARKGRGNAWVRNTTGWNAINIWRPVEPNRTYTALAWLRLSPTLTDGYFSVRNDKENRPDGNFDVINEIKLIGPGPANPRNDNYSPYKFDFETAGNTRVLLYVGLWGVGPDAWIQIDEVSLSANSRSRWAVR